MVRATPVTPAAAERSSGGTTAITYDWRVGTSICEILNRNIKTAMAHGKFGISGTRISNRFDGRWVKTMVLTRPKRVASCAAYKAERPANKFGRRRCCPRPRPARRTACRTSRRQCFGSRSPRRTHPARTVRRASTPLSASGPGPTGYRGRIWPWSPGGRLPWPATGRRTRPRGPSPSGRRRPRRCGNC